MLLVQIGFPPVAAFGAKSTGKGAALSLGLHRSAPNIPSGNLEYSHGKPLCLLEKSTINGDFP